MEQQKIVDIEKNRNFDGIRKNALHEYGNANNGFMKLMVDMFYSENHVEVSLDAFLASEEYAKESIKD